MVDCIYDLLCKLEELDAFSFNYNFTLNKRLKSEHQTMKNTKLTSKTVEERQQLAKCNKLEHL